MCSVICSFLEGSLKELDEVYKLEGHYKDLPWPDKIDEYLVRIIMDKRLTQPQKNKIRKIVNHLIQDSFSRLKIKKRPEIILDEEDEGQRYNKKK